MRAGRRIEFDHLPECSGDGFLYVAAMSDDCIKVGRTRNPRARLIQLAGDHRRHGASGVVRCDAVATLDSLTPERELISALRTVAITAPNRREFFTGVSYEQALAMARAVAFQFAPTSVKAA